MALAKIISYTESKFCEQEKNLNMEELVYRTTKDVLKKAGIGREQIDTVVQSGDDVLDGININHVYQIESTASFLKEESKVEADGAYSMFYAICRLLSQKFQTALVIGYSKSSDSSTSNIKGYTPYSEVEVSGGWYYHMQLDPFYLRPLGMDVSTFHAMQYSSFLSKNKFLEEDIAKCLVKNKQHGLDNSNAPFSEKISVQDVLGSSYISTPLKEKELPPQTDGVSAMIISTDKWAKENNREGVSITGLGSASDTYYPGHRDLSASPTAKISLEKALKVAKIQKSNIEFAELYDLFPYQEVMLYKEFFGWSNSEIKEKLNSNYTSKGGGLPVNLSGGTSCAHPIFAAGLSRIIHIAKNIEKGNYSVGLAHSQSGLCMQNNISYILQS